MDALYTDRRSAGRALAEAVREHVEPGEDVLVLGLPRGGVPVAFEVARALGAPLDVLVVRKLGVPRNEELAMGAVAGGGVTVLDEELVESSGITPERLQEVVTVQRVELTRREQVYREGRVAPEVEGRTVVVVDDGLATGASMRAALRVLKERRPARVLAAAPTGSVRATWSLHRDCDGVVCAATPEPFLAVGESYADFTQTSDEEVVELLALHRTHQESSQEVRGAV